MGAWPAATIARRQARSQSSPRFSPAGQSCVPPELVEDGSRFRLGTGVVRWRRGGFCATSWNDASASCCMNARSARFCAKLGYCRPLRAPASSPGLTKRCARRLLKKLARNGHDTAFPDHAKDNAHRNSGSRCYGDGLSRYFGSPKSKRWSCPLCNRTTPVNYLPSSLLSNSVHQRGSSPPAWPGAEKPHLHRDRWRRPRPPFGSDLVAAGPSSLAGSTRRR